MDPPWTLVGGAALVGFHLGHRKTRDLDLFWRQRREIGELEREAVQRCNSHRLNAKTIQRAPAFVRLSVSDQQEQVMVDLVADASPAPCEALSLKIDEATIYVAPASEILAAKLCALLSRTEARDLYDVMTLVESGEDLDQALESAAKQDTGFSALTLAWVLQSFKAMPIGAIEKIDNETLTRMDEFRQSLIERLLSSTKDEVEKKTI
jgi:hypothetical protein